MQQKHPPGRACCAIRAASESVNHLQIPTSGVWMDFVDRACAVCATSRSHTIDISDSIYCNSAPRAWPKTASGECGDGCLVPSAFGLGELVHPSAAAFTPP